MPCISRTGLPLLSSLCPETKSLLSLILSLVATTLLCFYEFGSFRLHFKWRHVVFVFFCLTCVQVSPILQHITECSSFSWLSNIPLCVCVYVCITSPLSTHLLMDTEHPYILSIVNKAAIKEPAWWCWSHQRCRFSACIRNIPWSKMATHFNILAWRTPWTEELGGLQATGSQRVRHDWACTHTNIRVHVSLWYSIFIFLDIYPEVGLIEYMVVLFLFSEETPCYFPQWLNQFTFPPTVHKGSLFSAFSPTLTIFCILNSC